MKRSALAMVLAISLLPFLHAQKVRFGQQPPKAQAGIAYPIAIHISGIHRRTDCDATTGPDYVNCRNSVYADAELNGTKIELAGYWIWTEHVTSTPLGIGDYQARMLKDTPSKSPLGREYELVFPDRTIWRGTVTGISE